MRREGGGRREEEGGGEEDVRKDPRGAEREKKVVVTGTPRDPWESAMLGEMDCISWRIKKFSLY